MVGGRAGAEAGGAGVLLISIESEFITAPFVIITLIHFAPNQMGQRENRQTYKCIHQAK